MFVSKKKYEALLKDHHECIKIAERALELNDELSDNVRVMSRYMWKAYKVLRKAFHEGTSEDWPIALEEAIGYLGSEHNQALEEW